MGHLSKPGIGTFTTVINDNAEYFRKNKYSIDSTQYKKGISVKEFKDNYNKYSTDIDDAMKEKKKKKKTQIKKKKKKKKTTPLVEKQRYNKKINELKEKKNKETRLYGEINKDNNGNIIPYDSNYSTNVIKIKDEIDNLEQGIAMFEKDKFKLVDKSGSITGKSDTYTILKFDTNNIDNVYNGIAMTEDKVYKDNDEYYYSAKVKSHNYKYYDSLDCFTEENFDPNNPSGASTSGSSSSGSSGSSSGASTSGSSSSGSSSSSTGASTSSSPRIVDIDTFDKENNPKQTPTNFKLKRKNGVGNVEPDYFKLISRLLNLEKNSRLMDISTEGFIIKIYAPGNKGILKYLVNPKHITPPITKDI